MEFTNESQTNIMEITHPEQPLELKGNEKRIASCKKVGGEKKHKGHKREQDFNKQYNPENNEKKIEYGPTSDSNIANSHTICDKLKEKLNLQTTSFNTSNKSGNNIQFTLGVIPELKDVTAETLNSDKELVRSIFNKYLKKTHSSKPADLLVYKDNEKKEWIFFKMDDIIEYICNNCTWRMLDSGRLKGDFPDSSTKGSRQYITYEYRRTNKSYFLGLNGGAGIRFIELLKNETYGIPYYVDSFNYETTMAN